MKKSLTIGIFVEHYDPFVSGVITSVKGLKNELENRGHQVYIVTPVVRGHKDNDPAVIRTSALPIKALGNTSLGLPLRRDVNKLMKIKFDVIHSQDVFYISQLGYLVAKKQGVPYIQNYHTLWNRFLDQYKFPTYIYFFMFYLASLATNRLVFGRQKMPSLLNHESAGTGWPSKFIWRHMLNMGSEATSVVVPSAHLAHDLKASRIATPINKISNGVAPFKPANIKLLPPKSSGKMRILSVARLSPEKRVEVLIRSLAHFKNAELVVVGDGATRKKLEKIALSSGVISRIRFMGSLSNEAVRQLMRECDVLAHASYHFDNQPMVFLEAIEAGLPIIYCDPLMSEGLTKNNSILAANTPRGFARAFTHVASDTAKLAQMATASQEIAKEYSISKITDQLLVVYQSSIISASYA